MTMQISIRQATEADLNIIQELASRLLNFERINYDSALNKDWAFSKEATQKYLSAVRGQYVTIAFIGNTPSGFLIGKIMDPQKGNARNIKQAYLQNIFVEEAQRGLGIGKLLVDDFKRYCLNKDVSRINVSVLAQNRGATGFYEKMGFIPRSINLAQELTSTNLC